ncbi:MAG: hypothetical protein ACK522_00485 [Synechococcaceae cyanobacterium]|jgi:hypothetical protein
MPAPESTPDPIAAACRRRLADGPRQRWLWAGVGALVCSGVPPLMVVGSVGLLWQGIRCRSPMPALFGLALFGGFAFLLLSVGAGFPPAVLVAGVGVFALGHHQGQQRAARDGRRWLALDQER